MKKAIAGLAAGLAIALAQQAAPQPPAGVDPLKAAQTAAPPQATPVRKAAAKAAAKPAAPAVVSSYKDLKYPPMPPVPGLRTEALTLENGLKLYLVEDRGSGMINGLAVIHTGNLFDPRGRVGVASLTGQVIRTGGTRSKTTEQLNLQLENMAATLDSSIGESLGSVSFSGLADYTDPLLDLFKSVLTEPEFRQDKVDEAQLQLRNGIVRANLDTNSVVRREFSNAVYGQTTPYGWPLEFAGVDQITRADLKAFYERYYFPKNTIVAIWGDFDATQVKGKIEKVFGDWKAEQAPSPEFPKVTAAAPGTYLLKKNEMQTQFMLGSLGGEARDRDDAPLQVMAEVLGGGASSRLGERLRKDGGGTVAAAWAANLDHPGLFEISCSVPAFQTVKAVRAARAEAASMRQAEVTEDELQAAKQRLLNHLLYSYDTKAKAVLQLTRHEYFGYPKDFAQQEQKAFEAVTRADVLRVAKERMDPDKWTLVVAGNPISFDEPLEKLGAPVLPIEPATVAPKPAAALEEETRRKHGRELLARAQAAAGGVDKLAALKDYTWEAGFQFDAAAGGMQVTETDRWVAPNSFRQDSVMPSGRISAYVDGAGGWIATPQATGALEGTQLKQVQGDLFRSFFSLLLSDRTVGRAVISVDEATVEISDTSGQAVLLAMDPRTALPLSATYRTATATGDVSVEETYSDYRDVSGLKLPFHTSITTEGRKYAEVSVKQFQMNTGLQVKDLEKKP